MRARGFAVVILAVGSFGTVTSREARATPPPERTCNPDVRTDVPTVNAYEALEIELNRAKATLEAALEAREATATARDAAALKQATHPGEQNEEESATAASKFGEADIAWRNAVEGLECAERNALVVWNVYRLDKIAPHSIAFGVSAAGGAGGENRAGGSVRFVSRPDVPHEYELSLAVDGVRQLGSDQRHVALSPRIRMSFGTTLATFFLGVSPTFVLRDKLQIAVVGQIGAGLRNPLGRDDATAFGDAKLFVEPWVPLDGAPVTVLFGVELGAVFGVSRRNPKPDPAARPGAPAPTATPWVHWQVEPQPPKH